MKFIGELYDSGTLLFSITIQSKASQNQVDKNLINKHLSKVGNQSLIFSPKVSLIIRSKDFTNQATCWIPGQLIYVVMSLFQSAYKALLNADKMYQLSEGFLYLDKNLALKNTKKISLWKSYMSLVPTVIQSKDNSQQKGLVVMDDSNQVGTLTVEQLVHVISYLDHLDVSTYSMMAGIVDALEANNAKLDRIMEKLDTIQNLLSGASTKAQSPIFSQNSDMFKWTPVDGIEPFM